MSTTEHELDLETLKKVKNMFGYFSDHSTNCLGYRSLCEMIENMQKEKEPEINPDDYIIKRSIGSIILKAKDQENTMDVIIKAYEEHKKSFNAAQWSVIQRGTQFDVSFDAFFIIKKANLLDKYFVPQTKKPKKSLNEVIEEFKKQPWQFAQASPLFVHSQVCPICKGAGIIIADGFTSSVFQQCPKCNGERTIPMIKI